MRASKDYRHWLVPLALVALTACSNGRGSLDGPGTAPVNEGPPASTPPPQQPPPSTEPPPTQPPPAPEPEPTFALEGYWKGSAVDAKDERTHEAVALIDQSGEAQLMVVPTSEEDAGSTFVLYGNVCCESRYDDDLPARRPLRSREEDGEADVEFSGGALRGRLRFRGRDYALNLTPSGEYRSPLTLAALAGVYTQTTTPSSGTPTTTTLSIESTGRLTGSNSAGCVFNGNVSIPNPARNMARVEMEASNCGGIRIWWNGSYNGLGVLLEDSGVFYHSAIGPTWFGPQAVQR